MKKNECPTVMELLEDIASQMCDNYCKYPEQFQGDPDEMFEEVCSKCPMTRL